MIVEEFHTKSNEIEQILTSKWVYSMDIVITFLQDNTHVFLLKGTLKSENFLEKPQQSFKEDPEGKC